MSIKDRAFASYVTTHVAPRKGAVDRQLFEAQSRRWNATLRRFLPDNKGARIIDIGCGNGSVVWWLHQIGYAASEGIDLSAEQVAIALQLGVPNVHEADLRTYLSDRNGAFDVIMARDVFEHFDRDSLIQLLDLIYASLTVGGVLVFQVPNAESPFGGRIRYGDITHELAFTSSSVSQLMHLAGFQETQVYPVEPIIYGVRSYVRLLAWKCVQAFYQGLIAIEIGRGTRVVSQNLIAVARR